MSERACPDSPGFQERWRVYLRGGMLPWISRVRNPYREALVWRYAWVSEWCKRAAVLDVPCGMGWGTSMLKGCGKVIGLDNSHEAVAEAKRRYRKLASFVRGDMAELAFVDGIFDVVACLEGIEHVPQKVGEAFIEEAARVLRPRGLLFLSSPYCRTGEHSGNPYHIKEYKPSEIEALLNRHFEIVSMTTREVEELTVCYLQARRK